MELTIKRTFKNELEFFKIYDNYIHHACIFGDSFDLEFILIGINNKYYAISYEKGYCISQIEKPLRDAKEIRGTIKIFNDKEQMSEYLLELINANEVIQ